MKEHPFAHLKDRADVRRCCAEPSNIDVTQPQPNLWVGVCRKCGRRHRKLFCEPGSIFGQTLQAMAGLVEVNDG